MSKVIVGIHGLANKPEESILADWWKKSIMEGLEKNCEIKNPDFDFKMVYWANLLHYYPQHLEVHFSFDALYNKEPYVSAKPEDLVKYKETWMDWTRKKSQAFLGSVTDYLHRFKGMDSLGDWVAGKAKVLRDIHFYYEGREIKNPKPPPDPQQARRVLMDDLKNELLPLRGREIMLISHSMGSIIAYDVLRDIGQEDQDFKIDHFVTIGSPLGLSYVKDNIVKERTYDIEAERVRTPTVVSKGWKNFADKRDMVAFDTHLRDDFKTNRKGIRVIDDLVKNDYVSPEGKPNHHKSYGYLRTPELSEYIRDFISGQ